MNVIWTVVSLHPDEGGPPRTVSRMCEELARQNIAIGVVTTRTSGRTPALVPDANLADTAFARTSNTLPGALAFRRVLTDKVKNRNADIIHDNGIWLPTNHQSAAVARKLNVPLVVTVRGMLEPWALNQRKWKKKLAWHLYQKRDLETARVLHATSEMEAESIRKMGLTNPVAVIPNGVMLPPEYKKKPSSDKKRRALFLSRIHPKKGLLNLVKAWDIVRPDGWKLIIAGPDEDGHKKDVQRLAAKKRLSNEVRFTGPVADEAKWNLYWRSDLFVLPTFSENFGVVVAEALAGGIPVITTKRAPWKDLHSHGCGWWIDIGVEPLANALQEAMSLSADERLVMGQRGRVLVEEKYSWSGIARQMRSVYKWIVGEGAKPECVYRV